VVDRVGVLDEHDAALFSRRDKVYREAGQGRVPDRSGVRKRAYLSFACCGHDASVRCGCARRVDRPCAARARRDAYGSPLPPTTSHVSQYFTLTYIPSIRFSAL
jgi:hypothetical protein